MQAPIFLLLALPAFICAVPCTDNPTGSPSNPPTNPPLTNPPSEPPTELTDSPNPTPPLPSSFPSGTYGLPMADAGCPAATGNRVWLRYFDTEDYYNGNKWNTTEHFKGWFKRDGLQMYFCMKPRANSNTQDYDWPAGDYCLVKRGSCPIGFSSGSLRWDGEDSHNRNYATTRGDIRPDGTFGDDTEMGFCCRSDGSAPLRLPNTTPFYLFRYQGPCQPVYEMTVTEEVVFFDDEDSGNTNSRSGAHPYDSGDSSNHQLHFCYYEKAEA